MASRRNGVVEPRYRYCILVPIITYISISVELFRNKELLTNPTLVYSWATRHFCFSAPHYLILHILNKGFIFMIRKNVMTTEDQPLLFLHIFVQ